jgi:hypothetical protein
MGRMADADVAYGRALGPHARRGSGALSCDGWAAALTDERRTFKLGRSIVDFGLRRTTILCTSQFTTLLKNP